MTRITCHHGGILYIFCCYVQSSWTGQAALVYLDWLHPRYQRHLKSEGTWQFCSLIILLIQVRDRPLPGRRINCINYERYSKSTSSRQEYSNNFKVRPAISLSCLLHNKLLSLKFSANSTKLVTPWKQTEVFCEDYWRQWTHIHLNCLE